MINPPGLIKVFLENLFLIFGSLIKNSSPPASASAPLQGADRPRFGINSLINRMTGHAEQQQEPQAVRHQPSVQQQAAVAPRPTEAVDPDQERIEIPAFLRRQAN